MPTNDQIIEALRPVEDPELHRSIVDLDMMRDVRIAPDGSVALEVTLTVAGCPLKNEIQSRVSGALAAIGVPSVDLSFGVMTDEQRAVVREKLQGERAVIILDARLEAKEGSVDLMAERVSSLEEAPELNAVQGKPADIGGYYRPDPEKAARVMRPSQTLNDALDSLG